MPRLLLAAFVVLAVACSQANRPDVRVVGAQHQVVFVQVTNPASHPMRLSNLEYTFLADNRTVSKGNLVLDQREVPAGEAIVVQVPLDTDSKQPMTLTGTLTAELDQIVRIFQVQAQIRPH
jgi:LEA14-like dessication related protein